MKKLFILAVFFICAGCTGYKDIKVSDPVIKEIEMVSFTSADVDVEVVMNNPTGKRIILEEADGYIYDGSSKVAKVVLKEPVEVVPKYNGKTEVKLTLSIESPAIFKGLKLTGFDMERYRVGGRVLLKSGGVRKNFYFDKLPISKIINL